MLRRGCRLQTERPATASGLAATLFHGNREDLMSEKSSANGRRPLYIQCYACSVSAPDHPVGCWQAARVVRNSRSLSPYCAYRSPAILASEPRHISFPGVRSRGSATRFPSSCCIGASRHRCNVADHPRLRGLRRIADEGAHWFRASRGGAAVCDLY